MPQKIFIGLVLTLVIMIFIPLYWATESGRQEAARERFKTEAVERGAELYTSLCAVCHGPAGEGKIGPALKGYPNSEDELKKTVSRGIAGTAMPAFDEEDGGPLKEHQIRDLVTFIRNWDSSLLPLPEPMPSPTETPAPIVPSINVGELYTGRCAACHGEKREGISGLGPALTPESLAGLSDGEVRDTISGGRLGAGMPPFNNTLSPEEIDALIQFIKHISP